MVVAIVVAAGNAVVPFMSAQVAGVVTIILGSLASIFHTSDVKQAVASASAAKPQSISKSRPIYDFRAAGYLDNYNVIRRAHVTGTSFPALIRPKAG